ncbi:MAG: hypothetical protein PHD20_02790 [Clostridia bacterium]|nr:hypothetical protein [Clostridia bacterium]
MENWNDEKLMRSKGLVKYEELKDKAQKEAHDRFAWDFINNKWKDITEEEVLIKLNRFWFDKNGGTYMGTA